MTHGALMITVLVVLVAVLVAVYVAGTRVKRRIESEAAPTPVSAKRTLKVTPACVARLRALSEEPVLMKLNEGVLRYQVGTRPMAPVAVAPGEAGTALREVGTALVTEFGAHWVAVVKPAAEDAVSIERLA
jgi:hypothetical protein